MSAEFSPLAIFTALNRHGVRYVVIGGVAATLHGSSVVTNDTDICYQRDRENLARLVAALNELEARPRGFPPGLPFILDEHTLRNGDVFTFDTIHGPFDCLGTPQPTNGYPHLEANAVDAEVAPGIVVRFSSLDDLIRMKRAAGRPKDLFGVEHLEELKRLIQEADSSENDRQ
jgi:hypothetical protein